MEGQGGQLQRGVQVQAPRAGAGVSIAQRSRRAHRLTNAATHGAGASLGNVRTAETPYGLVSMPAIRSRSAVAGRAWPASRGLLRSLLRSPA